MEILKWNAINLNKHFISVRRRKTVAFKFSESHKLVWNKSPTAPEHVSCVNLSVMISKLLNIIIQKRMALILKPLI